MVESVYTKHTLGTGVKRNMSNYYYLRPFPRLLSNKYSAIRPLTALSEENEQI